MRVQPHICSYSIHDSASVTTAYRASENLGKDAQDTSLERAMTAATGLHRRPQRTPPPGRGAGASAHLDSQVSGRGILSPGSYGLVVRELQIRASLPLPWQRECDAFLHPHQSGRPLGRPPLPLVCPVTSHHLPSRGARTLPLASTTPGYRCMSPPSPVDSSCRDRESTSGHARARLRRHQGYPQTTPQPLGVARVPATSASPPGHPSVSDRRQFLHVTADSLGVPALSDLDDLDRHARCDGAPAERVNSPGFIEHEFDTHR